MFTIFITNDHTPFHCGQKNLVYQKVQNIVTSIAYNTTIKKLERYLKNKEKIKKHYEEKQRKTLRIFQK